MRLASSNSAMKPRSIGFCARVAALRMAPQVEPQQPGRSDQQPDAADGAQQHRQARQRIRRVPVEAVVIQRRDAGRGEAKQEAVEREVMEAAAPQGECVVGFVATLAVAAVEILQASARWHVASAIAAPDAAPAATSCPEPPHAQRQRQHREQEDRREHRHHQIVREHRVEIARERLVRTASRSSPSPARGTAPGPPPVASASVRPLR